MKQDPLETTDWLPANLPEHIAIVMDGNGRWARARGKPRVFGHQQGVNSARTMVECCGRWGVKELTLFAFSSENWKRPQKEVGFLMQLFVKALSAESKRLHKKNVRLRVIGDTHRFDAKLRKTIRDAETLTASNTGLIFRVAANYGGRWDISQATRAIASAVASAEVQLSDIDEPMLSRYMSGGDSIEPQLFIRTGGEVRISNFLLWQLAYTELYFCDTLWPDFGAANLAQAILEFARRDRRFGQTSQQLKA